MKRINIVILITIFCFSFSVVCLPQDKTTDDGWAKEEPVFSKVLEIRARELEKKSGIKFDADTKFKAIFEWSLGRSVNLNENPPTGQYFFEDGSIRFVYFRITHLNAKYKSSVRNMNPEDLAKDDEIGQDIDHELGHKLMDQVSRRNKLGICYTREHINSLNYEQQMGLKAVTEGVAEYFESMRYPLRRQFSEEYFPSSAEELRRYTFTNIAYEGGYWLVKDILKDYGEPGLIWLIKNPFVATEGNMREAAIVYRQKALLELAEQKKKMELSKPVDPRQCPCQQ